MQTLHCDQLHFPELIDLDDKSMAMKYWLSPVDPWEAHDTAATELLSGTGKWFITSDVFRGFLEKIHRGIWLCGVRRLTLSIHLSMLT